MRQVRSLALPAFLASAASTLDLQSQILSASSCTTDSQFDMEVGLGPGHIVLNGDPAHAKWGTAPNFQSICIVAKRLDGWRCH